MAAVKPPIADETLRAISMDLMMESLEVKAILNALEKRGIGRARANKWVKSVGGTLEARRIITDLQMSQILLLRPVMKELYRRITDGSIGDKELVTLLQIVSPESTPNKSSVNITMSQFLKEAGEINEADMIIDGNAPDLTK